MITRITAAKQIRITGSQKDSGRTFLKCRMKFVNTSGKTGNIKYMETILKGVKRRIVIVWESKTERIGE